MANYTSSQLVEELQQLLTDLGGRGVQSDSRLMADIFGRVIENFRLQEKHQTQPTGPWNSSSKLTAEDIDNLGKAARLHERIMGLIASAKAREAWIGRDRRTAALVG